MLRTITETDEARNNTINKNQTGVNAILSHKEKGMSEAPEPIVTPVKIPLAFDNRSQNNSAFSCFFTLLTSFDSHILLVHPKRQLRHVRTKVLKLTQP